MKSHRKVLTLQVRERAAIINITEAAAVRESSVLEGPCLVSSLHITSSVFIHDEDAGLKQDDLCWQEKLAPIDAGADPASGGYVHNRTGGFDGRQDKQVPMKVIGDGP